MTTYSLRPFDAGGRLCASITPAFEIINPDGPRRA